MERTATLFMNGGSQAVRLPKDFRFEGVAVRISRDGERVILEPIQKSLWPKWFFEELNRTSVADDLKRSQQPEMSTYRDSIIDELDK